VRITSRANARLKAARRLQAKRHRRAQGVFLAEGEDLVGEALAAGILPVETFVAAEWPPDEGLVGRLERGGPVHEVADELLGELGTLGHPARVIAAFRIADLPPWPDDVTLALYLHRLIDPGNVGTIVRAAGALGPAAVGLSPGCSDPLSGKGVRASMGAIFRVPLVFDAALPERGDEGRLVALAPGGEQLITVAAQLDPEAFAPGGPYMANVAIAGFDNMVLRVRLMVLDPA